MRHLLLAVFVASMLVGCSDQSTPDKVSAEDIRVGKDIADRECKACHGLDGKGVAPGIPNLAGQRGRYIMTALQEYKEGRRVHAALRSIATDLSEDQTRGIAAYYASQKLLPPAKVPVFSPYENGKSVAEACTPCHGADGNSTMAGTPNLAGQQPIYFITATQEYLTGKRDSAPMIPLLRKLGKLDIESVALYFASQTPTVRPAPAAGNAAVGEPRTAACGGCHGAHGISIDTATPSLAAQDPKYLAAAIKGYRSTRRSDTMARVVANLGDREIDDIVAFYATQKSKPAEDGQNLLKAIADKCNRCHAGDVRNPALAIPVINAQDKDYLVLALRAYRDGKRGNSLMHNMSVPYGDAVIESIASYYASLPAR